MARKTLHPVKLGGNTLSLCPFLQYYEIGETLPLWSEMRLDPFCKEGILFDQLGMN